MGLLHEAPRSSHWVVGGPQGSAVRWSQVPILTPLFTNCKIESVFNSLALSFFQWDEDNMLTLVQL